MKKNKNLSTNNLPWQELFDQLPTGIVIIDNQGKVETCNNAAQGFLGENIIGEKWLKVINDNFSPQDDDGHEISLNDGRKVNIAIESLHKRAGEMIIINDLTLTRTFEHERERQNRLQEMGEMLAHLTHQIRTPLASAMLHLTNLQHPNISLIKQEKIIAKIKTCHQNIEQQIQDLLVFAKGGGSLLQNNDMCEFLISIKRITEDKLNQKKATLEIDNQIGQLNFICHSEALSGAISNLIDNALNANAQRIFLNVIQSDNVLIFNILDDGMGMSTKVINQVIRPFFTTRAKGTGLGLAVVDAVVKSHQGELKIMSKEGKGSTFSIKIPLLTEKAYKEAI